MSVPNLSRDNRDFRAAAGLARWSTAEPEAIPEDLPAPRGPGLFEVINATGRRAVTNVRRLTGAERTPGSALVSAATVLLALLVACALGSAGQNYAAADVTSPRSVAAYLAPSLFLALVVDRVVAVVRRHVLGDAERSVWATAGRGAARLGLPLLYLLRFVLAPPSTAKGVRRLVLDAAPVPGVIELAAEPAEPKLIPELPSGVYLRAHGGITPHLTLDHVGQLVLCTECPQNVRDGEEPPEFGSKREAFEWHYRRHPQFGDRQAMSQVARLIGEMVGLQWGTSRTYAAAILAADAISDAMDAAREC